MSSYVPPHQRKPDPLSKENFPSLSGTPVRSNANPWNSSFASKAREWNKKTEEETFKKNFEQERERQRLERERIDRNSVFVYHSHRNDYDDSEYSPVANDVASTTKDDWETVERKQRVELSTEEKIAKQEKELAEELQQRDMEETAYGNDEWDYRDRRTIS